MGYMGQRGRGGMRPPRGRMMIDERPRMGHPGSHYISKTGHSVHMRGMPFLAIEQDVFDVSRILDSFPIVFRLLKYGFHEFELQSAIVFIGRVRVVSCIKDFCHMPSSF